MFAPLFPAPSSFRRRRARAYVLGVLFWMACGSLASAQTSPAFELGAENEAAANDVGAASANSSGTPDAAGPGTDVEAAREAAPGPGPAEVRRTDPDPSTPRPPEASTPAQSPESARPPSGFSFGSYGRVITATNLRGGTGRDADIVTNGPRLDESTYAELELRRDDHFESGIDTRIVATLALAGPLFHTDGNFDAQIAVRNLFAETSNILTRGLSFWVGSRMVRGDDIYLLDHWPLDNLNMVGGGARYAITDRAEVGATFGLARPNNPFYTQTIDVAPRMGFLVDRVLLLDRPRMVASLKGTYWLMGRNAPRGVKLVLYGEGHQIASGERRTPGEGFEHLPRDGGFVLGAQIGAYSAPEHAFVNVFARYATGLASYDPLGIPFQVGSVISTERARHFVLGLAGNYEIGPFGVQVGALFRYFRDADPSVFARGSMTEGVVVARPMVWFGQYAGLAVEASYQTHTTSILDEATGEPESGKLFKLGIIPFLSPSGRGTYTRPHFRLIYSLTTRDAGARRLYSALDPRSSQSVEHFFGLGVEWWFNSTSYQ